MASGNTCEPQAGARCPSNTGSWKKKAMTQLAGITLLVTLFVCFVTGLCAWRKGYNFLIWFFAAGVIGLLILAFLPFVNKADQPEERKRELRRTGNTVGAVIAALALAGMALRVISFALA